MAVIIDDEYGAVRKDIMMSVVNQEADQIAQDVVDSQVKKPVDQTPAQPKPAVVNDATDSVSEALAVAEAELSVALGQSTNPAQQTNAASEPTDGVQQENTPADPPTPSAANETPTPSAVEVTPPVLPNDEETAPQATIDQPTSAASEPTVDKTVTPNNEVADVQQASTTDVGVPPKTEEAVKETPTPEIVNEAPTENETPQVTATVAKNQPVENAALVPPPVESLKDDAGQSSELRTPDRAEEAVAEIEKGIRKISGILSGEVQAQWDRAKHAFDDIAGTQKGLDDAGQKAEELLKEIAQFHDESKKAHDEMESMMRDARQYREDAKQAKRRADNSADAAENSADQASQEAHLAKDSR